MSKSRATARRLAAVAAIDADEVMVTLWDAGLHRLDDPDDQLSPRETKTARAVLGLPSTRELTRLPYWTRALGKTEPEITEILAKGGLRLSPAARTLPKGAVSLLRRAARERYLVDTPRLPVEEERREENPIPPLEWRTVGSARELRLLDSGHLEAIHSALVKDFARSADPISPPGLRDRGLLESAVFRQSTSSGGEAKYPSAEMAAAALLHSVVNNHPFFNGNKRTGLVSMMVLLDENGLILTSDEDTLFKLILRITQHQVVPRYYPELADREVMWIAEWIHQNSRAVEKGERPLQWRKLKQVLGHYDCDWSPAAGGGNRLNIHREVSSRGMLGRRRRQLSVQVKYLDDGREAQRHVIHEIRKELELDEENGVDSGSFYGRAPNTVDDFILRYSKILKRLARL